MKLPQLRSFFTLVLLFGASVALARAQTAGTEQLGQVNLPVS